MSAAKRSRGCGQPDADESPMPGHSGDPAQGSWASSLSGRSSAATARATAPHLNHVCRIVGTPKVMTTEKVPGPYAAAARAVLQRLSNAMRQDGRESQLQRAFDELAADGVLKNAGRNIYALAHSDSVRFALQQSTLCMSMPCQPDVLVQRPVEGEWRACLILENKKDGLPSPHQAIAYMASVRADGVVRHALHVTGQQFECLRADGWRDRLLNVQTYRCNLEAATNVLTTVIEAIDDDVIYPFPAWLPTAASVGRELHPSLPFLRLSSLSAARDFIRRFSGNNPVQVRPEGFLTASDGDDSVEVVVKVVTALSHIFNWTKSAEVVSDMIQNESADPDPYLGVAMCRLGGLGHWHIAVMRKVAGVSVERLARSFGEGCKELGLDGTEATWNSLVNAYWKHMKDRWCESLPDRRAANEWIEWRGDGLHVVALDFDDGLGANGVEATRVQRASNLVRLCLAIVRPSDERGGNAAFRPVYEPVAEPFLHFRAEQAPTAEVDFCQLRDALLAQE